jgi:hypothetical protein
MQEDGTREENANILNLFLSGADLLVGAPSPISAAQTTEPVDGLVFNDNFTRERYGKAAVSDNIALESDRLSLLTDTNMSGVDQALAICAALEFDNAVSALNSGTASEFDSVDKPSDIDGFSRRPETMYINSGKVQPAARDKIIPAFRGNAEPEFIDALVNQAGGDPANFSTFADVAADQSLMQSIAADSIASGMISSHPNGMPAVAGSQTAMQEVAGSQTAMQEVAGSQAAMQEVAGSRFALKTIGSNANENIAANTILNSAVATAELKNSPFKQRFEESAGNSRLLGGRTLTDKRVIVTSNNNGGGGGSGINFQVDVGPQTQPDTTFIINEANANDGNSLGSASVGFNGIVIE